MGQSRDLDDLQSAAFELGPDHLGHRLAVGQVRLVQGHDAGPLIQRHHAVAALGEDRLHCIGRQFGLDGLEVGDGIAIGLQGAAVQHVDQGCAAFDVTQELQSEPLALGGAGDQTGDVGHGVADLSGLDHTQVGHQGGEGIVRDLGAGGRQGRDQRGLAGGREADQRDVRHGLELQHHVAGITGDAQQGEAGGLALLRGQGRIAQSSQSAFGHHIAGALADHVGQDVALPVLDHGAVRHGQHQRLTVLAVTEVALAAVAVAGVTMRCMVVGQQRGGLAVHHQGDVAAVAAVAAVGAAEGLELLPLHRDAAMPPGAAGDMQDHAVHESCHDCLSGGPDMAHRSG